MDAAVTFTLKFDGSDAEKHQIDLYDVSVALVGFQRSLALTAHLIINGEIITQAPALKGAKVLARPSENGSWELTALVLVGGATALYKVATAPKDTVLGHLIYSAYDYVISESLGFHVDYEKSLGQIYEEHNAKTIEVPQVEQYQLDSLAEKCTTAITEIHRPIFKTGTADKVVIESTVGDETRTVGGTLDLSTYNYIHESHASEVPDVISGRVSSYNSNTFKGRIYVPSEGRPIPFELSAQCRSNGVVELIVASLSANAIRDSSSERSTVHCKVFRITSRSGHLKKYSIVEVSPNPIE